MESLMYCQLYATAIAFNHHGILFFGESGSGKSDFAYQLIQKFPSSVSLISDDRVDIYHKDKKIFLSPPSQIAGLLEVRGVGIITFPFMANIELTLCVNLRTNYPRLPVNKYKEIAGKQIPLYTLNPFELTAPFKLNHIVEKYIAKPNKKAS